MSEDIDKKVARIEAELRGLHIAVAGGELSGQPGILQNVLRMFNTLYDEREGLVPRLTAMERRELERVSWLRGAWFISGGIGTVLGAIIAWVVHVIFK